MFCALGLKERRLPLQWNKTCSRTLILASHRTNFLGRSGGCIEYISLLRSKNGFARTNTVFFSISQVCTRVGGWPLIFIRLAPSLHPDCVIYIEFPSLKTIKWQIIQTIKTEHICLVLGLWNKINLLSVIRKILKLTCNMP